MKKLIRISSKTSSSVVGDTGKRGTGGRLSASFFQPVAWR